MLKPSALGMPSDILGHLMIESFREVPILSRVLGALIIASRWVTREQICAAFGLRREVELGFPTHPPMPHGAGHPAAGARSAAIFQP